MDAVRVVRQCRKTEQQSRRRRGSGWRSTGADDGQGWKRGRPSLAVDDVLLLPDHQLAALDDLLEDRGERERPGAPLLFARTWRPR